MTACAPCFLFMIKIDMGVIDRANEMLSAQLNSVSDCQGCCVTSSLHTVSQITGPRWGDGRVSRHTLN